MSKLNYSRVMGMAFERPVHKGNFSFAQIINTDLPLAKILTRSDERSERTEDRKSFASIFNFRFSNSFLRVYEGSEEEKYYVVSGLDYFLEKSSINANNITHSDAFYKYLYGINDSYQYMTDNPWLYGYMGLQRIDITKYLLEIIEILESISNFSRYFSLEGEWGADILVKAKTNNVLKIEPLNIIPLKEYKRRFSIDKFNR
jgi:hypothetical protein